MEKLIDDGIDAQFLNPSNLQEQVRSIQQSLNSENQVCSESFNKIRKNQKYSKSFENIDFLKINPRGLMKPIIYGYENRKLVSGSTGVHN